MIGRAGKSLSTYSERVQAMRDRFGNTTAAQSVGSIYVRPARRRNHVCVRYDAGKRFQGPWKGFSPNRGYP